MGIRPEKYDVRAKKKLVTINEIIATFRVKKKTILDIRSLIRLNVWLGICRDFKFQIKSNQMGLKGDVKNC